VRNALTGASDARARSNAAAVSGVDLFLFTGAMANEARQRPPPLLPADPHCVQLRGSSRSSNAWLAGVLIQIRFHVFLLAVRVALAHSCSHFKDTANPVPGSPRLTCFFGLGDARSVSTWG